MPPGAALRILVLLNPQVVRAHEQVLGLLDAMPDWRPVVDVWQPERRPPDPADCAGILAMMPGENHVRRLLAHGRPVVNTSSTWLPRLVPNVTVDDRAVGRLAALHLAARGCRRLVFLGREKDPRSSAGRRAAGLAAAGLPTAQLDDADALLRHLDAGPGPVGVLALNDLRAHHLAAELEARGIAVGARLLLVGVGDEPVLCQATQPALSSIGLPWRAVGAAAAKTLADLLAGRPAAAERLIPPVHLVARASSDRTSVADALVARSLALLERADGPQDVDALCRAMGASRATLCRRFAACGLSPGTVLRQRRIERACALLAADPGLDPAMVGRRCGWRGGRDFARTFARHTGLTPGRWQVLARGDPPGTRGATGG